MTDLPTWDQIDAMVEGDPIALRDLAWRLRCDLAANEDSEDASLALMTADRDRLRRFVKWVATLDQPDPEPGEEGARLSLDRDKLAAIARHELDQIKEDQ